MVKLEKIPTTIPGLVTWFDAFDPNGTGILPADGSEIATWVDKSGHGKHATANVGERPTFNLNSIAGHPGLLFNGSDDFMSFDNSKIIGKPYSIFVVFRRTSFLGGQYVFGSGSGVNKIDIGYFNPGINRYLSVYAWTNVNVTIPEYNNPIRDDIICVSRTYGINGDVWVFVNNASGATSGNATVSESVSEASATLGKSPSSGTPASGLMSEVLVYDRLITFPERSKLILYCSNKYGTEVTL
jgi:hypothetical protein